MNFYDSPQWQYLAKRWQNNNLPHALLLTGQCNLNKTQFATEFTKYLLCQQKQQTYCGECRNCQLMQAETYPDFYLVQPEEQGKAIRVDQVRELIAQLNQTSQQTNYKIVVINPADNMNQAAANALLKTLEEPTSDTFLFLIADQISLLSATIRSRCQIIKFSADKQTLIPDEEKQKLLNSLNTLTNPVKAAADWLKTDINQLIDWLMIIAMEKICTTNQKKLFDYLDKLYTVKRQLLASNLNQQLLLEDLFCHWEKLSC